MKQPIAARAYLRKIYASVDANEQLGFNWDFVSLYWILQRLMKLDFAYLIYYACGTYIPRYVPLCFTSNAVFSTVTFERKMVSTKKRKSLQFLQR